jgi:undecaprenyl-diphosphatase
VTGARVYAALLVLGALALAALSIGAYYLDRFPGDVAIARAVQAYQASWVETLTTAVSWTGFPPQSNIIFGSIVVLVVVLGQRWAAAAEIVAAFGSGASYFLLQHLVARPRPTEDLIHVAGSLPMSGFPSGHMATFTAVFGVLAFVGYRALGPSRARWLPVGLVAVLLILMSFARMYAGQHWPSDVLAGGLLGALWVLLAAGLCVWCERSFRELNVFPFKRTASGGLPGS